jgi:hypothetical protein
MNAYIQTLKTIASNKDLTTDSDKKRVQLAIKFIIDTMNEIIICIKESSYDKKFEKKIDNLLDDMFEKMEKYFDDNKTIKKLVNEFDKTVSKCLKEKKKNAKCPMCKDCLGNKKNLSCGHLVHVSCVVKAGCDCCPVCKTKVKLSVTNQTKCEKVKKSKVDLVKKEKELTKEVDAQVKRLKELGYFTCSESDCSCQEIRECCSESDCDCSSSDSEDPRSSTSSESLSDSSDDSSSDESDDLSDSTNKSDEKELSSSSSESESEDENIKINYEKLYQSLYGKLQMMEKDNPKIKQTIQSIKNIYNKLKKNQQDKYKEEYELIDILFE